MELQWYWRCHIFGQKSAKKKLNSSPIKLCAYIIYSNLITVKWDMFGKLAIAFPIYTQMLDCVKFDDVTKH